MFEFYLKGGLLMHPILLLSVIALTLSLERLWYFLGCRTRRIVPHFEDIENALIHHKREKAREIASRMSGPIGKILQKGLGESNYELAQERMAISGELIAKEATRGLSLLALIPSIATMLGLLGTVLGLVAAFKKVAFLQGNVSPALLASGIWVALITTVAGLIVAIPSLIAHHFFQSAVAKLQFEMEHYGSRLLLLLKSRASEPVPAPEVFQAPSLKSHAAQQDLQVALSKRDA